MTTEVNDEKIKELEKRISNLQHKEQDVKIDQLTKKLESLEGRLSVNSFDKNDDNLFKSAEFDNFTPKCNIEDDKVRGILSSSETPVSHVRYNGKLFGGQYEKIVITNKRIIFYKIHGTFGKKIKHESIPLHKLGFPTVEEKGLISKKAILKIDVGLEEPIKWEDNPSKIHELNQQILSVVREMI